MYEPRCRICTHHHRNTIDQLLKDNKYSLQDVLGVAKALSTKDDCPSLQSLRRHRDRHLLNNKVNSALKDLDPQETVSHTDPLYECLVSSLSPLSADDYDKVLVRYQAELDQD